MTSTPQPDSDVAYRRQRARFLRHLVADGRCNRRAAERMLTGWEHKAAQMHRLRGTTSYWKDAWLWIAGEGPAEHVATKHDMGAAADGQVYGG